MPRGVRNGSVYNFNDFHFFFSVFDSFAEGPTDGPKDRPTDGPTDRPTDGPTDGWMDWWTHTQRFKNESSLQRLTIFNCEYASSKPGVQNGSTYDHNDIPGRNRRFRRFCLDAVRHTDGHTDGQALIVRC